MFPLIPITPGPWVIPGVPIGWYGLGYVVGLTVMLLISQREAERRGYPGHHIWGALLLVGAMALIGGRLYHVIDQWGPLYSQNPLSAILPPYSGLGLYGGVAGAALGIIIYTRWKHIPVAIGLDSVIVGTFFAQAIARWGNFFNQELYGPPTDLPWGIAIDCAHRVAQYPCSLYPLDTTGFHPLFFYESALTILGGLVALFLSRRYLHRLQPGDLAAFWAIWYGVVRILLESFREGWNWTLGGIPTAQIVGAGLVVFGVAWIAWNHRPGNPPYEYLPPIDPNAPPVQEVAPVDEEGFDEEESDEDGFGEDEFGEDGFGEDEDLADPDPDPEPEATRQT